MSGVVVHLPVKPPARTKTAAAKVRRAAWHTFPGQFERAVEVTSLTWLERLLADPRWPSHAASMSAAYRTALLEMRDRLDAVLAAMPEDASPVVAIESKP